MTNELKPGIHLTHSLFFSVTNPKTIRIDHFIKKALKQGYLARIDINDLLYEFGSIGYWPESLFNQLSLPTVDEDFVYPRKKINNVNLYYYGGLSLDKIAFLLIRLEMLGFAIDPSPLVNAVFPEADKQKFVTSFEAESLLFTKHRHKRVIEIEEKLSESIEPITEITKTGYKVGLIDVHGTTLFISKGPNARKKTAGWIGKYGYGFAEWFFNTKPRRSFT